MSIDRSAVAQVLGITTEYRDTRDGSLLFLPQRIAIVAQGASSVTYPTDKKQITSAGEAGAIFGYGSPIHLAAQELFPTNGDGVGAIPVTVYPLVDDVAGVAAEGAIEATGSPSARAVVRVVANNIRSAPALIEPGMAAAAIAQALADAGNAVLGFPMELTVDASELVATAKWKGASGNGLRLEIEGEVPGVTFSITQPTGGLGNPTVDGALAKIGSVWETMILNALEFDDTTALDAFSEWGEGRWGTLAHKPAVVFTGNTEADVDAATAVCELRRTDRVNAYLVAPGSKDLPFVVAARQVARIAKIANNNPARNYIGQRATRLTPGAEEDQWDAIKRELAVSRGCSTIEVQNGEVTLGDVVTFYRPEGDPEPAYRHVCDIAKLQQLIFNIQLEFASETWRGAPLVPDGQVVTNPDAKKPSMAKAAMGSMLEAAGRAALVSDPTESAKGIIADITGPKRLDVVVPAKLSGNSNIIDVRLHFSFYWGAAA